MSRKAILAALRRAMQKPARGLSRTRLGATARSGGLSTAEAAAMGAVPAVAVPGIIAASGTMSPLSRRTQMETDWADSQEAQMDALWAELERKKRNY